MRDLARSPSAASRVVEESQAVLAQHAKSFRLASWFLPRGMRRDASVIYAFCRLVDDAVDDAASPAIGRARLNELADMLRGSVEPSGLVAAYRETALRLGFGLDPAWSLLAGAESDLHTVRIEDDGALLTYCYRVAGTVGLMMCGVLGVAEPGARAHAVQLGVAMQLTNICRDVREDATLGRVYLPRARLLAAGLEEADVEPIALLLAEPRQKQAILDAILGLLAESERVYALAAPGFRYIPARPRLAILVAARLYRAIGRRLRRAGGDALAGRTIVPTWQKVLLIARAIGAWVLGLLLPDRPRLLLEGSSNSGAARPTWPMLADSRRPDPYP